MKQHHRIAVAGLTALLALPARADFQIVTPQSVDDAAALYYQETRHIELAAKECKRLKSRFAPELVALAGQMVEDAPGLHADGKRLREEKYASEATAAAEHNHAILLQSYKKVPAKDADTKCVATLASSKNEAEKLRADAARLANDAGPFQVAEAGAAGYTEDQVTVNYYMLAQLAENTLKQCRDAKDANQDKLQQAVDAYRAVSPQALRKGEELVTSGSTGMTAAVIDQQLQTDRDAFAAMDAVQRKLYCSEAVQGVAGMADLARRKWH